MKKEITELPKREGERERGCKTWFGELDMNLISRSSGSRYVTHTQGTWNLKELVGYFGSGQEKNC